MEGSIVLTVVSVLISWLLWKLVIQPYRRLTSSASKEVLNVQHSTGAARQGSTKEERRRYAEGIPHSGKEDEQSETSHAKMSHSWRPSTDDNQNQARLSLVHPQTRATSDALTATAPEEQQALNAEHQQQLLMNQLERTDAVKLMTGMPQGHLQPQQQSTAESTDSDDSFQIVNRPTELELMADGEQMSRIVTSVEPSSLCGRTSLLTKLTDTLRKRSSLDTGKPTVDSHDLLTTSGVEMHSNERDEHPRAAPLGGCNGTSTTVPVVEQEEVKNEEEEEEEEEEEKDDGPADEVKTDDESDEGVQDTESKTEDGHNSDGKEEEKESVAQTRKKREWMINKILASARAERKAEKRRSKKRERSMKPKKVQEENSLPTGDETAEDASDESEEEWDEEGEEADEEIDLTPDAAAAEVLKAEGNLAFKEGDYRRASNAYTKALLKCPSDGADQLLSVLLANRGACHLALKKYEAVLTDCSDSIELDNTYVKAYVRRFRANEALEKWHDALADINKAIELDPSLKSDYYYYGVQKRVEKLSQEQFEREKAELVDKLKTFGNWALGKVGLSLENFKLDQNPETGAYNIQFVQNQGGSAPTTASSSSSSSATPSSS